MLDNFSLCTFILIPSLRCTFILIPSLHFFLTLWYHTALSAAHTFCKINIHKYYWQILSSIIITIMLVCPRCGTSNLHNRRSLSIHLARYCTGRTGKSTSRSHDGRHSLSMATTSHQQARHFNAPEVNITLPTMHTLRAMPSMSHLSSTHTDLAPPNVRYADFDDADYSHDNDNHDFIPVHGVDDIIIEKCSFLRNRFRLPPDVAFQVHCLSVI